MNTQTPEFAVRSRKLGGGLGVWVAGFTLLIGMTAIGVHGGERETASDAPFLLRQDEPLTQYRALRRMHAVSERFNQEGWLDAWTEFDGQGFRYQIVSERGSEYIRNKVLKTVLRREQELIAEGHADRAALTAANYQFSDVEEGTSGVRYVLMKPRRKEVTLVDGRMVLSPDGTDLIRIEGRLAKNPSFWTSLVNVTRHFAKIDGILVPVSTESIAKIKFAGHSRMAVYNEYETINGRPVSLAARQTLASAAGLSSR